MEKLENSKLGILSTLFLSIQEEGEELSLTHSLTKHWLPSSISQDLLQWSGEMNIAKQAVCKKKKNYQGQAESGWNEWKHKGPDKAPQLDDQEKRKRL